MSHSTLQLRLGTTWYSVRPSDAMAVVHSWFCGQHKYKRAVLAAAASPYTLAATMTHPKPDV
jgi:hypothetical protein